MDFDNYSDIGVKYCYYVLCKLKTLLGFLVLLCVM